MTTLLARESAEKTTLSSRPSKGGQISGMISQNDTGTEVPKKDELCFLHYTNYPKMTNTNLFGGDAILL
jgi:hypothetical protein